MDRTDEGARSWRQVAAAWAPVQRAGRPAAIAVQALAGAIAGLMAAAFATSFALMVYAGPAGGLIWPGASVALFGAAVVCVVAASARDFTGAIWQPHSITIIAAAQAVAAVAMAMPGAADETLFATIFALLALSTLPAGRLIMAIGAARRGQLAKSVPYPVVGGFFAAIGHFLPKNGALLSVGGLGGGMAILSAEGLRRWLPPVAGGVAGALVARAGGIRFAAFLGVLACLALFHGWLSVTGTSIARARGEGLLLASGIGPWGRGWLSSLQALGTIDASVILGQLPAMPSVAALALPGVLLCLSGIEHMTGRPVDLNRALRTTGWANLGCGLGGGFVGDHRRR